MSRQDARRLALLLRQLEVELAAIDRPDLLAKLRQALELSDLAR